MITSLLSLCWRVSCYVHHNKLTLIELQNVEQLKTELTLPCKPYIIIPYLDKPSSCYFYSPCLPQPHLNITKSPSHTLPASEVYLTDIVWRLV